MINRTSTYIDTNTDGLVVQIQHNMSGTAYPEIYEVNLSGHKKFISLFDARIAEAKALDDDTFQMTFAAPFAGFVDLLVFDVKQPSQSARIIALEKEVASIREVLKQFTNLTQWKQMNSYLEDKINTVKADAEELRTLHNNLAQDVSEL